MWSIRRGTDEITIAAGPDYTCTFPRVDEDGMEMLPFLELAGIANAFVVETTAVWSGCDGDELFVCTGPYGVYEAETDTYSNLDENAAFSWVG